MRLSVTADTRAALERLRESTARSQDVGGAKDLVLGVLRGASARQFATGAGWAHSEKAGQTLVATGTLRDSFTQAGGDARVVVTQDSVRLVSLVDYAEHLADGARGMPRRNPSDIDEWRAGRDSADVLAAWITGEDR